MTEIGLSNSWAKTVSSSNQAFQHSHDASVITTGTLPVARGGTGVTSSTGTGSVVLNTSPTISGTPYINRINQGSSSYFYSGYVGCYTEFDLNYGGTFKIGNGSITYSSDSNLKKNIVPLSNCLAKLEDIQPVTFNWLNSSKTSYGFIAQNIQQIYPEIVSASSNGELSLEYNAFFPILAKCIQEQQQKIQSLEARIALLESSHV